MDQVTLKDWRGTEYTVGSKIVYVNGTSYGNTWRTGVVTDIIENTKYAGGRYGEPEYIIKWYPDTGTWGSTPPKAGRLSNLSKIMAL